MAVTGKLGKRYSKQLTVQRKTKNQSGIYKREYELRVDTADGGQEIFEFQIDGKDDLIKARRGDEVTVLATTKDRRIHEILFVDDHTMGKRFELNHPGTNAKTKAGCTAMVVAPGSALMLLLALSAPVWLSLALGLVIGVLAYIAVERELTPRVELEETEQKVLEEDLSLRTKREALLAGREEQERSIAELERVAADMTALLTKMESVGDDLYQSRISAIRDALPRIRGLIDADRSLVMEYEKAITIIEIEEGSRSMAITVDGGALAGLDERLDSIEVARRANDENLLELRALAEVERFLQS